MDVKVVLVTTLLFVNYIVVVVSQGNMNSTENISPTTDVNGITESHTATTETLTVTDTNIQVTTSADKPIVSESNMQNISTTETLAAAENYAFINTTTESSAMSDGNVESTASDAKPIVTEVYVQSTTTTQTQDVTDSVTTIYKVETKTKSVAEFEPNMDRFIDPPTPSSPNTDIAFAVKVEGKEIKETHPADAETTIIPDLTASADSTTSIAHETTTFSLQEDIPLLLKELIKQHISEENATLTNTEETTSGDALVSNNANSDKKQGDQVIWWESIKPNRTDLKTATVTVKNADIDTRIITTDKLVIVISTICGSFVLFVVILIVVSCCRRNGNGRRTDSEKSGTSEFSVVSTRSNGLYEKQSSTKSRCDSIKSDYNDVFMGIPTNNAIWKDLDNLPDTTGQSNGMPESTKL